MFQLKLKEQNRSEIRNERSEIRFLDSLRDCVVSFWIDSSGGPKELCKNSFYGVNPKYYIYGSLNEVNLVEIRDQKSEIRNQRSEVRKESHLSPLTSHLFNVNCFDFIEQKLEEEKNNPDGIFVGYFSYDLFRCRSVVNRTSTYPDFFFAYFDKVEPQSNNPELSSSSILNTRDAILTSNMTDSEYLEKVKQIKEEIKAGNVYQVNLTREYSIELEGVDDLELYLKLRSASPNPYGCYFKTPFVSILSSSPEEFIYVEPRQNERYIRTRPIKGTLPENIFEIDSKNQAENIMIVDLERNDLGRICEYGSVQAKKLLEIESYKHLNHVVSTVEGRLNPGIKLKKIFEAMFPSGSITGAPKIAAMKIIEKIEPTKRGAYTGSFGYIRTDGTMNFNILIRTIFVQSGKIVFNAGGGIVADSEPESELE